MVNSKPKANDGSEQWHCVLWCIVLGAAKGVNGLCRNGLDTAAKMHGTPISIILGDTSE